MAETQEAEVAQQTDARTAEFEEVQETLVPAGEENLDLLLDIHMPITVNLGRTVVPFRQLLQMGPGSVLQLDKIVGQPAELYVQDVKFATGDIVVVDDHFAVRITEILQAEAMEAQED